MDKGQTEDNTEKRKSKEGEICKKRDFEAKLGKVFWQLQANLKCNIHGVGERLVQEQEDGQASFHMSMTFHFIL